MRHSSKLIYILIAIVILLVTIPISLSFKNQNQTLNTDQIQARCAAYTSANECNNDPLCVAEEMMRICPEGSTDCDSNRFACLPKIKPILTK